MIRKQTLVQIFYNDEYDNEYLTVEQKILYLIKHKK